MTEGFFAAHCTMEDPNEVVEAGTDERQTEPGSPILADLIFL